MTVKLLRELTVKIASPSTAPFPPTRPSHEWRLYCFKCLHREAANTYTESCWDGSGALLHTVSRNVNGPVQRGGVWLALASCHLSAGCVS